MVSYSGLFFSSKGLQSAHFTPWRCHWAGGTRPRPAERMFSQESHCGWLERPGEDVPVVWLSFYCCDVKSASVGDTSSHLTQIIKTVVFTSACFSPQAVLPIIPSSSPLQLQSTIVRSGRHPLCTSAPSPRATSIREAVPELGSAFFVLQQERRSKWRFGWQRLVGRRRGMGLWDCGDIAAIGRASKDAWQTWAWLEPLPIPNRERSLGRVACSVDGS